MKLAIGAALALALVAVAPSAAEAREHQVKMLNKGSNGKLMMFEPAFIKIAPGDTVKFLATNKGHNAESIPGMAPAGGNAFKGKINEEIVFKSSKPGLYGIKCQPHLGMGMVGLIQVGNAANKPAIAAAVPKLPGLSKKEMAALVAQAR